MKAKFKKFIESIGLTKAQLITVVLCYFLCFALFLGVVVIWDPMSKSFSEQTIVADDTTPTAPTNTDGLWITEGRYSIEWFNNPDTETYGDGSESNPYVINSAEDLAGLSWLVYTKGETANPLVSGTDYSGDYIFQGKYFKQTANIDLSEYYWQPIGIYYTREGTRKYNYFSGSYDGGNHTVSRVFTPAGYSNPYSYQGLFGYVCSLSSSYPITIKNIGVINSFIQGYEHVGGVMGYASDTIRITNCYNTGSVSGSSYVGGVVGYANVSSSSSILTISNCYNTGVVTGSSRVGGVMGEASVSSSSSDLTITNCYNTGSVNGSSNYVGGIVGQLTAATAGIINITVCYNTGTVNGSSSYIGGIVGRVNAEDYFNVVIISNCYNIGSIEGLSSNIGGIVGSSINSFAVVNITNCYNMSSVSGSSNIGGVVGYIGSRTSMTNCYYGVKCSENVGGINGSDVEGQAMYSSSLTASSPKAISWYTTESNWNPTYPWDFENVWVLDEERNEGYPTFIIDYWINDPSYYSIEWFTSSDKETYGDGSESNPYIIDSAEDLAGLSWLVYTKGQEINPLVDGVDYSGNYIFQGKFFKQTEDIDLSVHVWQPIGISYTREGTSRYNFFSGNYDGGNHTVSGIFTPAGSSNAYSHQGLFGYVYSSSTYPITIKNIGISNSFIQGYQYVGGVVGDASGSSSGSITITNCYNTGAIGGSSYVGGVVGSALHATITNCYNTGSVSGSGNDVGGVVGDASGSSSGSITITNCYNTGAVTGSSLYVGGVVGDASGTTITNCYNTGAIGGSSYVGGVVGDAYSGTTITNCYNTGSVSGSSYVGGVVGRAYFGATITITNCYNTGSVSGSGEYVGGVVGRAYFGTITITNCYNTGAVTGSSYVGGVVGDASGTITITNCYYGGGVTGTLGSYGTYLSNITSLAKKLAWYVDKNNWNRACLWDFNLIWQIDSNVNSGYPTIKEFIGYWTQEDRFSIEWYTKPGTNDGSTADNPYIINSAKDLAGLSWLVYTKGQTGNPLKSSDYSGNYIFQGKYFKQTVDIDLSAYYWQPIGIEYTREGTTRQNYFSGSYDGGNHTVSGIYTPVGSSDGYSYQGLFGYVCPPGSTDPTTIQNIGITNSFIQGYRSVGGVVGYARTSFSGTITITNCYNTGVVSGSSSVGGVVGEASGTLTITNCYNTGAVSGSSYVGGVVGRAYASFGSLTITNCYNTGNITDSSYFVGGVVGSALHATITNCYNTGSVSGSSRVGGVVGDAFGTITITNCYNIGDVSGSSSVGGVVGEADASSSGTITITNCYNIGDVSGSSSVGGVVGDASDAITITNCYNTGDVSGSSSVGGVVGNAYASSTTGCNISKSANFGDITVTGSSGNVGGIVGYVRVTNSSYSFKMTNCYSEGSITVSGTNVTVGGFVGNLYADYSTYSNVKIEFCSVDLDIIVSGGSMASQGVFYGGTNGIKVENSYSLLTKSGTVSKVISDVSTQMDNNFGYMLNFKEGKPIPLGIFHILDVATRTGIVNRINAL